MSHRQSVLAAATVLGVLVAVPAVASAGTVTANGVGQAKVALTDRHHNAPIVAAVTAAHAAAVPLAIADAREEAQTLASAAHLTLGALESVAEPASVPFFGPPGIGTYDDGPFGPGRFCGTVRLPIFKKVHGKRRVTGTRKVHRCEPPSSVTVQLSVTFAAS